SVWLEADPALTTLLDFHYKRHYHAERGTHGEGSNRHGATGQDLVLRVPIGTVVTDRDTGTLIGELAVPGQRVLAIAGSPGGRGGEGARPPGPPPHGADAPPAPRARSRPADRPRPAGRPRRA